MACNDYRSVRDDAEGPPDREAGAGKEHMLKCTGSPSRSAERRSRSRREDGQAGQRRRRRSRAGDTVVLATATAGNLRDVDFLPLTVDVEERMYAAGKIPGSFFKREGRAGEKATLIARMIDRPMRPLFPKGWRRETQLVAMPLSVDQVHPYDILAMNGASRRADDLRHPVPEPVGAVRIGKVERRLRRQPDGGAAPHESDLDLIVAGTEEAILMVEAGANEVPEAEILDALDIAHGEIKKLCAAQHELREKAGKPKLEIEVAAGRRGALRDEIAESHGAALDQATSVEDKLERQDATKAVEEEVLARYSGEADATPTYAAFRQRAQLAFDVLEKKIIRERIAVQKKRPDGRAEARSGRSRSRSSRCRARTARRCSRAVRRRRCRSSRSAPRARRCGSTASGWRRPSATSTTTTSRRSRWARPASCAARSAGTSAMARSPSVRWSR